MRVLLAGGGSAGHTSPLLATADALRRLDPATEVTCLGTREGLEARLVPEAGLPLELVPRVPLPRRPSADLLRTPTRLRAARAAALEVVDRVRPDVVVGFGGYVSVPAYLAARKRGLPIVVHEGNAIPGIANKLGARMTQHVATSFPGTDLPHAVCTGLPIRRLVSTLDRGALRAEALASFGLRDDLPTLVVTGGSQGAARINAAVSGAAPALAAAGVQVLHIVGPKNELEVASGEVPYVVVNYVDRMDLAYAAADAVLCRSGSNTVTEVSGVGLPAIYVPLPIGNGEQALNARPVVDAGGGLLVADAALTPEWVAASVPGLMTDTARLAAMGAAARGVIPLDADEKLARMILDAGCTEGGLVRIPVPDEILPAADLGRVHCVGIGGAGISAIARIMAAQGVPVTGSDDHDTPFLPALRELGVTCHLGYDAAHVGDADTLVVTTAAREDNPEVLEARRRGLRILPRSAGLAAVMAGSRVLAVAGTHGKTTTTGLLTSALLAAGVDPSYAVGGVLTATGRNADAGSDDLFVAEADESDGAFLVYRPHAAIVTNVEADHLDNWGTEEAYHRAFDDFADTVDRSGFLVCVVDDPGAALLAGRARAAGLEVVTVGESDDADLRIEGLALDGSTSVCRVRRDGAELGELRLRIPGRHYVLDAVAALAMGLRLGCAFDDLVAGLGAFTGTGRRMELKGEAGGVRVYDSYAHHPVEISGDLEAARALAGEGRVVAAFQPHLVSRTRIFGEAMGVALGAADEVVVLDVYVAREEPDAAVTGRLVADAVPLPAAQVAYVDGLTSAAHALAERARPGDLVITLGAGDITGVGPQVLDLLGGA